MSAVQHSQRRVAGLDVLRVIAVVAVVLYHYPRSEDQMALRAISHLGWAGVDLFFVLSGYLIAGQLFSRMARGQPLELRDFYLRRLLRTLPNYFVVLGALLALGQFPDTLWRYLVFAQNIGMPRAYSFSWSLCVEEHFYLFFPLLAISPWVRGKRAFLACIGGVLAASIALRAGLWLRFRPDLAYAIHPDQGYEVYLGQLYYPTYTRLDGLTVGVALAAVRAFRRDLWTRWEASSGRFAGVGLALLGAAAFALRDRMSFASCVIGFPLLALGFGSLLVSAASPTGWLNRLRVPGVEWFAVLSYSIYLTHVFAIDVAARFCAWVGWDPHGWGMAGATMVAVPALGSVLYYGVERVFLGVRDRLLPGRAHLFVRGAAESG